MDAAYVVRSIPGEPAPVSMRTGFSWLAITAGGLLAGILDLTQALILFGPKVPLLIAGGLLGPQAFHGGTAVYLLGIVLHFFIAFSAAAIYYMASRRLVF